jgi:hypothetical protein
MAGACPRGGWGAPKAKPVPGRPPTALSLANFSVPPSLSCGGRSWPRFGPAKPSGMASFGHWPTGWRWAKLWRTKGSCPQPSRGFLGGPAPRCPSAGYPAAWPVEGGLIGRPRVAARIWPSAMIKTQIGADRNLGLGHRVGGSERDLLVCARPQAARQGPRQKHSHANSGFSDDAALLF